MLVDLREGPIVGEALEGTPREWTLGKGSREGTPRKETSGRDPRMDLF
jgi:hypothetical protein